MSLDENSEGTQSIATNVASDPNRGKICQNLIDLAKRGVIWGMRQQTGLSATSDPHIRDIPI